MYKLIYYNILLVHQNSGMPSKNVSSKMTLSLENKTSSEQVKICFYNFIIFLVI